MKYRKEDDARSASGYLKLKEMECFDAGWLLVDIHKSQESISLRQICLSLMISLLELGSLTVPD
jgi:hypothetical protein